MAKIKKLKGKRVEADDAAECFYTPSPLRGTPPWQGENF